MNKRAITGTLGLFTVLAALTITPAHAGIWVQEYERQATETCMEGWNPSWAQWANRQQGGWVCTRTLDDPSGLYAPDKQPVTPEETHGATTGQEPTRTPAELFGNGGRGGNGGSAPGPTTGTGGSGGTGGAGLFGNGGNGGTGGTAPDPTTGTTTGTGGRGGNGGTLGTGLFGNGGTGGTGGTAPDPTTGTGVDTGGRGGTGGGSDLFGNGGTGGTGGLAP